MDYLHRNLRNRTMKKKLHISLYAEKADASNALHTQHMFKVRNKQTLKANFVSMLQVTLVW